MGQAPDASSGGPDLTPWRAEVGALLETWSPGGPGGTAVAGVLFGDADPGGRPDRYRVSVTVTNTGERRGWAVPELYLAIPSTVALSQPPDELKGFAKLSLAPHRHRTAAITLDAGSFSSWDTTAQAWQVAPGCDTIMVGSSSGSLPLRARVAQGGVRCR